MGIPPFGGISNIGNGETIQGSRFVATSATAKTMAPASVERKGWLFFWGRSSISAPLTAAKSLMRSTKNEFVLIGGPVAPFTRIQKV